MSLQLTAQLYKQILASLRSDAPNRSANKRTEGRVGLRCTVDIVPHAFGDKGAKPITVWVRDISLRGIGLVTPTPISENMSFIARLPRDREEPLKVTYTVVYCRRLSSDLYSVGAILEKVEQTPAPARGKPAAAAAGKAVAAR